MFGRPFGQTRPVARAQPFEVYRFFGHPMER